ncbi:MAG: 7-carboxy-7-deazaguanine synthase QueE [Candidatus Omnitrophica bacterium]|nr:7-carboxy-7-deazaguanine synthase QueE [Candidatus Omnitrophota bacterium]MCM8788472.1 7-carboxy-7-deazaguanine synthase QueE [Candidatus Omnitrophota bacterium]
MVEICEIFSSIQGEGWRQGIPSVFIRCFGCNLKCEFCDTPQAFKKKLLMDEREIMKRVNILARKKVRISNVIITGGEPYIQDLSSLVDLLKKDGYFVSIETNGTIWRKTDVDWICVSPKKQALKFLQNGYDPRFKKIAGEFKYVIEKKSDFDFIDRKISQPVILQPLNNNPGIAKMLCMEIKKSGMPNWFFRPQLHKVLGIK